MLPEMVKDYAAVSRFRLLQTTWLIYKVALLQVSPNHRQAINLKEAVDDRLVKDGLIGVGIMGGGVMLAGIVAAVLSSRR